MVKVQPKDPFLGPLLERLMRRGDHAHINVTRLVITDPLQLAALEEPKHLGLELERQLADFVQEKSSAIRSFDASGT